MLNILYINSRKANTYLIKLNYICYIEDLSISILKDLNLVKFYNITY
jgi:hypothetical protein